MAYRSAATNLVAGATSGIPCIFLYDQLSDATTLLSVSQFGDRPAANRSLSPVFSGDGQTLVFGSWAPDLMSGDFNLGGDVFAYSIYASGAIPIFCARLSLGTNIPQQPLIIWPAPPGKSYRVQYKTNLTDSAWQNLNNGVTVVGGQAYCSDLAPAAVHRFYRVMAY